MDFVSNIVKKSLKTVNYIFENSQIDFFNTLLQVFFNKNIVFIIFQFKYV